MPFIDHGSIVLSFNTVFELAINVTDTTFQCFDALCVLLVFCCFKDISSASALIGQGSAVFIHLYFFTVLVNGMKMKKACTSQFPFKPLPCLKQPNNFPPLFWVLVLGHMLVQVPPTAIFSIPAIMILFPALLSNRQTEGTILTWN